MKRRRTATTDPWTRYRKACRDVQVTHGLAEIYLTEREAAWTALVDMERRAAKKTVETLFRRPKA